MSQKKQTGDIPNMEWLSTLEEKGSRYYQLSERLRLQLVKIARLTKKKDHVGKWRLSTEQVGLVRDGRSGDGVYAAMTRMLRQEKDKSASDWLWKVVAGMQRRAEISADAQRTNRGPSKVNRTQIGWRSVIGVKWHTWEGVKSKAMEVVLRIQGNQELDQVPRLMRKDRHRYQQLMKKNVTQGGALLIEAVLWVLAVENGVEVEWMLEGLEQSVLMKSCDDLYGRVEDTYMAVQELQRVRLRMMAWLTVGRKKSVQQKYLLVWFAGWPEVMRQTAAELGLEVIAVDIRELGEKHKLNVMQDLTKLAPQLWILDVLGRLGMCSGEIMGHWIALDCTASSRSDPSNRVRKGKQVFYNYRKCKDPYRRPQHSVGTEKGDKCRETDRLAEAALQVAEVSGLGWVFEQPDGQLQWTKQMRKIAKWKVSLDYCRLWNVKERRLGMQWQKMTVCWVKRRDLKLMAIGKEYKCQDLCKCRRQVEGRMEHVGQIEAMTEVMKKTGLSREQLKCRYPQELVRMMLKWLQGGQ